VSLAWDFLYIGNTLESADTGRQLPPSEFMSDNVRTMYHMHAKLMGKVGVVKEGKPEDLEKYMKNSGEEEMSLGGPILGWLEHLLKMDEIKGLKFDDPKSFRNKIKTRKEGYKPFPERTGVSLIEMLKVPILEGDVLKEMPLSEVLLKGKSENVTFDVVKARNETTGGLSIKREEDVISGEEEIIGPAYEYQGDDMCKEFVDTLEGAKVALDFLAGRVKIDPKDINSWSLAFGKSIPLIRQNKVIHKDGKADYLRFVDDPEFVSWIIASSVGFDHRSEKRILNSGGVVAHDYGEYFYSVEKLVNLPGLTKLGVDKFKVREYLSAVDGPKTTEKHIEKLMKVIIEDERKASKYQNLIRKKNK
jgi:hypothetical protein